MGHQARPFQIENLKPSKTYSAVAVIGILFMLLRLVWHIEWAVYAGLAIVALAIVLPWFAVQLANGWYKLAGILGKINSFILMSILFWLMIVPIGYLRKLFTKKKPVVNTTFIKLNQTYTAEYFNNPW